MSHIALVIHALHGGGAERVAATMANRWVATGKKVTVITLDTVASDRYPVDPLVHRVGLGLMRTSRNAVQAIRNNRQRVAALRAAIGQAQPNCVVSVTDRMNILTLLACRTLQVPVAIAEHSDPRHQHLGAIWEQLRRRTYRWAKAIVVLTRSVEEYFRDLLGDCPIYVIPNGIAPQRFGTAPSQTERLVVGMGRLSEEKDFLTLIDAFADATRHHEQWELEIAGEGPQRGLLEQQIARLGLCSRVRLPGWVDEPEDLWKRAAVFVLSSRYEGFPMALLEAMAWGVAVVSFDCDSGPREIIRHEVDGLLVDPAGGAPQLGLAIERLMADDALRRRLGSQAMQVADRFSLERFSRHWDAVLSDLLQPPGSRETSRQS